MLISDQNRCVSGWGGGAGGSQLELNNLYLIYYFIDPNCQKELKDDLGFSKQIGPILPLKQAKTIENPSRLSKLNVNDNENIYGPALPSKKVFKKPSSTQTNNDEKNNGPALSLFLTNKNLELNNKEDNEENDDLIGPQLPSNNEEESVEQQIEYLQRLKQLQQQKVNHFLI